MSSAVEPTTPLRALEDLVFVAFNARVFAVDRFDGTDVWRCKLPQGSGFVSLLLDGDRLIASSNGYTFAIDPWRGAILWSQPFKGEGVGIPSLASVRGASAPAGAAAAAAQQAAAAHNAAATSTIP